MSCPSGIYVVTTNQETLSANSVIPLNAIVRRYGNAVNAINSGVQIHRAGYYKVDANVTFSPTNAGNVTLTLYKDGVAVPGAVNTALAAANSPVPLNITAMVREGCCDNSSVLSLVVSGAGVLNNAGMVVVKL